MARLAVCRGPAKQVENIIVAEVTDPTPANCVLLAAGAGSKCNLNTIWKEENVFAYPVGIPVDTQGRLLSDN